MKGDLLEILRCRVKHYKSILSKDNGILEPRQPLVVEHESKRLLVRFMNDFLNYQYLLLLKEEDKAPAKKTFECLGLTPREMEILYWLSQGKTNSEIALILSMSFRTVKKHLEHIYEKLGVENRTSAAMKAMEILSTLK